MYTKQCLSFFHLVSVYVNVQQSPFLKYLVPSITTLTSNGEPTCQDGCDLSPLIMVAGFTAQVSVDENGQTCHAIGLYDKVFCSYCWILIKITSMGKHQDVGNSKCSPACEMAAANLSLNLSSLKGPLFILVARDVSLPKRRNATRKL